MKPHYSLAITLLVLTLDAKSCKISNDDNKVDFIFVVDGSGSIGPKNFQLMKRWIVNATSYLNSKFGRNAQFGLLQYSRKDKSESISTSNVFDIPFRLGDCGSWRCTSSRILSMRYLGGSTYTSYALRRAIDVEFPLSSRYPEAKKVLILLTDAKADDEESLNMMYDAANKKNITILEIAVGDFKELKLRMAANSRLNPDYVYMTLDWHALNSLTEAVLKEIHGTELFCDECKSGTNNCSRHAECIDHDVGYECRCISGYHGNGVECEPIDYCSNDPCSSIPNSYCINEWNGPACFCQDGYILYDDACVDIDSCQSNPCYDPNQVCVDHLDGYECLCAAGFWWDGLACNDTLRPRSNADFMMIIFLVLAFTALLAILLMSCYASRRRRKYFINQQGWDIPRILQNDSSIH